MIEFEFKILFFSFWTNSFELNIKTNFGLNKLNQKG